MHHRKTITIEKSREDIIRESLCREESVRLHRIEEAHIVEDLPEIPQETPDWIYPTSKMTVWEIITNVFNVMRI